MPTQVEKTIPELIESFNKVPAQLEAIQKKYDAVTEFFANTQIAIEGITLNEHFRSTAVSPYKPYTSSFKFENLKEGGVKADFQEIKRDADKLSNNREEAQKSRKAKLDVKEQIPAQIKKVYTDLNEAKSLIESIKTDGAQCKAILSQNMAKELVAACDTVANKIQQNIVSLEARYGEMKSTVVKLMATYIMAKFEHSNEFSYYIDTTNKLLTLEGVNQLAIQRNKKDPMAIEKSKIGAEIAKEIYENILETKQNIDSKDVTGSNETQPKLHQVVYQLPYAEYKTALTKFAKDLFVNVEKGILNNQHFGALGIIPADVVGKLTEQLNDHCSTDFWGFTVSGVLSSISSVFDGLTQYPDESSLLCSFKEELVSTPSADSGAKTEL